MSEKKTITRPEDFLLVDSVECIKEILGNSLVKVYPQALFFLEQKEAWSFAKNTDVIIGTAMNKVVCYVERGNTPDEFKALQEIEFERDKYPNLVYNKQWVEKNKTYEIVIYREDYVRCLSEASGKSE